MHFLDWPTLMKGEKGMGKIVQGLVGHMQGIGVNPKKWEATKGFMQDGESQPMYIFKIWFYVLHQFPQFSILLCLVGPVLY